MSLLDHLPEEFEGRESLGGKFESVEALAQSYNALHKQLGATARVPGSDASPEDWTAFYQKMGAPKSVEGYTIPENADSATKAQLQALRDSAHVKGVTADQWEALVDNAVSSISKSRQSAVETMEQAKEQWAEQARLQYGEDFDTKLAQAQRTFQDMIQDDGAELIELLETSGLGNHPKLMELFVQIGDRMADDTVPTDSGSGYSGNAQTLALRGRELLKKGSVSNPAHPEYERDYQEYMKIQQTLLDQGYAGLTDPRLKVGVDFPLYDDV